MTSYTKSQGFTLVELAIVLMIIGLLIGGILKGQELIGNARITSTIRQIHSYQTAVTTFRDSYSAWPGDITNPGTRIPNCTTAPCNVGGTGNDRIYESDEEYINFWIHLAKTNMISGIDTSLTDLTPILPKVSLGGEMRAEYYASAFFTLPPGNNLTLQDFYEGNWSLTVKHTAQIDRKMDDGKPRTGSVVSACSAAGLSGTNYNETADKECSPIIPIN